MHINNDHILLFFSLVCVDQILSYNRESMLLFTVIIDQSIFVEIVRKTMHPKPEDWFDKKRGGGCVVEGGGVGVGSK